MIEIFSMIFRKFAKTLWSIRVKSVWQFIMEHVWVRSGRYASSGTWRNQIVSQCFCQPVERVAGTHPPLVHIQTTLVGPPSASLLRHFPQPRLCSRQKRRPKCESCQTVLDSSIVCFPNSFHVWRVKYDLDKI